MGFTYKTISTEIGTMLPLHYAYIMLNRVV